MSVGLYRGQKKASAPLDLGSQTFGCHLIWVLGTKFQSPERAACAGNSYTVYPVLQSLIIIIITIIMLKK